MNRLNLVKKIAERLSIKEKDAMAFVAVWEEELGKSLIAGEPVALMGFGTFTLWKQPGRPGRNPQLNTVCMIAPRNSVKFKPGQVLLDYLNNEEKVPRFVRRKKTEK